MVCLLLFTFFASGAGWAQKLPMPKAKKPPAKTEEAAPPAQLQTPEQVDAHMGSLTDEQARKELAQVLKSQAAAKAALDESGLAINFRESRLGLFFYRMVDTASSLIKRLSGTLSEEVITLLHSDAARRGTRFSLRLAPRLTAVHGDKIQLQQVALNLVLNAFEAIQACREAECEVLIRTWRQEGEILAAVTDSGNGIPAGETEKIFKAFYTTKPQGLGMGLSICRSIITSHQGRLWAENNPERGATFYFSLPAAAS